MIILITQIDVDDKASSGFHFACGFLVHGQFVSADNTLIN